MFGGLIEFSAISRPEEIFLGGISVFLGADGVAAEMVIGVSGRKHGKFLAFEIRQAESLTNLPRG
jgi:hypothetical protein